MPCKKITSQDRRTTETFISRMTYATVTSGLLVLLQTGQLSIVIIYVFVRSVGVRLFVCLYFFPSIAISPNDVLVLYYYFY